MYVIFEKVDGNLVLTLTDEGREFLHEAVRDEEKNIHSDEFLVELIDDRLCNGWELLRPEEIGALTSAPILSDDVERDEDGGLTRVGTVYWFPQYQLRSVSDDLLASGKAIFTGVSEDTGLMHQSRG